VTAGSKRGRERAAGSRGGEGDRVWAAREGYWTAPRRWFL